MKKSLSIILAVIIAFSMITCSGITSFATDLSGSCGEGVTWKYTEDDKTLTISGDNLMDNYTYDGVSYNRPWESIASELERVVIDSGMLSVGDYAFIDCSNIKEIVISETVLVIGESAFENCTGLRFATLGETVMAIGPSAFEGCSTLSLVKICKETVYIGDNAFAGCPITSVIFAGLEEQLDYIYYEDENERFENIICADTVYDITIEYDYYDIISVASVEPFYFAMSENNCAEIIEAQYDVVTEDGVDYYVGAVAVYGTGEGQAVVYALNEENMVLDTYTVLVACSEYYHSFIDKEIGRSATCSDLGFDVETCCHCGHKRTSNYKYGEHVVPTFETIKEATCQEKGLRKGQCKICGEWCESEIPVLAHTWSEWIITLEPTEETMGEKEHECTVCGEKETMDIPRITNVLGDVNGDERISAVDARFILQYVAGLREFDENSLRLADVNGDGKISAVDARWVLQYVTDLRESFV